MMISKWDHSNIWKVLQDSGYIDVLLPEPEYDLERAAAANAYAESLNSERKARNVEARAAVAAVKSRQHR
jgi:hypothetical protein